MPSHCSHLNFVVTDSPNTAGCEECLAMGDTWVHLRLCRDLRATSAAATIRRTSTRRKHFRSTQHPIVTSLEPGEDWSWCYVDEIDDGARLNDPHHPPEIFSSAPCLYP